jgi:Fe-S cluster biogenesis protein NfuA
MNGDRVRKVDGTTVAAACLRACVSQAAQQQREDPMQEKVKEVLDKIRPSLQADGGDVELVAVEGGIVKVRLKGACAGCPMSQMTLKNGIERLLRREIPEVTAVEGV